MNGAFRLLVERRTMDGDGGAPIWRCDCCDRGFRRRRDAEAHERRVRDTVRRTARRRVARAFRRWADVARDSTRVLLREL